MAVVYASAYIYFDADPEWCQVQGGMLPRSGKYLCQLRGITSTDDAQSVGIYRFRYRKQCFVDLKTDEPVLVTHWCANRSVE